MANLKRDIRYINRDFNSFRDSLIEYSKTYFPNTYNDFSPESTGMLFMEMASYVGDVLSFYLDNQIQETFIQYARQTENLYNLAYMLGYKPKVTTASHVDIDFYQQVPAKTSASVVIPDYDYALLIPENTQVSSVLDENQKFLIEDVIDFTSSSSLDPTTVSIYQVQGSQPTYFLLKKTRKAISATIQSTTFTFNGHWEPVFAQAHRLLEGLNPDVRKGDVAGTALLFDMEKLFETVLRNRIRNACRKRLRDDRLSVGKLDESVCLATSGFQLWPDIVVKRGDETMAILDAKWKQLKTKDSNSGVSSSDAYQMNAYASRLGCKRLALVYPAWPDCPAGKVTEFVFETNERPTLAVIAVDLHELASGKGMKFLVDLLS